MSNKVIITCALNGVLTDPRTHPVPYTPEAMAQAAHEVQQEGAAVVHVHLREQQGGRAPSWDRALAVEIIEAIRSEAEGIIVNMTTGVIGEDVSGPLGVLEATRPEMAAMNAGSLNYLKVRRDGQWAWPPMLFDNPVEKIERYLEAMRRWEISPECECFDLGIIRSVGMFAERGMLPEEGYSVSLVQGVASGMPARADLLEIAVDELIGGGEGGAPIWQSVVIGRQEVWAIHRRTAELGGQLRCGLEDTFYRRSGERAERNADLISDLVAVAREAGREVASAEEARAMLGLQKASAMNVVTLDGIE